MKDMDTRKKALVIAVGVPAKDAKKEGISADHEHEIEFLDDSGNGSLSMVEGHTHAVVKGKVQEAVVDGKSHSHELPDDDYEEEK